jgi:2-polyprenyl-3-methyl-5-hydroxy-6-metoxy-1,4-benzoquinol methylase
MHIFYNNTIIDTGYCCALLIKYPRRHLKDFGDAPQAVRWTPEGQKNRYEKLFGIAGDLSGKHILDFGCGKGDFFGFLKES